MADRIGKVQTSDLRQGMGLKYGHNKVNKKQRFSMGMSLLDDDELGYQYHRPGIAQLPISLLHTMAGYQHPGGVSQEFKNKMSDLEKKNKDYEDQIQGLTDKQAGYETQIADLQHQLDALTPLPPIEEPLDGEGLVLEGV